MLSRSGFDWVVIIFLFNRNTLNNTARCKKAPSNVVRLVVEWLWRRQPYLVISFTAHLGVFVRPTKTMCHATQQPLPQGFSPKERIKTRWLPG